MPLGTAHPLDADGASYHLYYYLAKEHFRGGPTGTHLESARVNISPTVIFEQGFAKAWFTSVRSPDAGSSSGNPPLQVKRKLGREVSDLREIFDSWTRHCKDDREIAALLVSSQKKDIGDPGAGGSLIQYFTKHELDKFLFSPGQKPKGILQKFMFPKGSSNTTIQATWSPQVRTLVEGRRNVNRLDAYSKTPFERAATFEATGQLAHEVSITPSVAGSIQQVCSDIVHHLHLVEHIRVTGMVLHFKVDKANRVRLLYSSSIRVMTDAVKADVHSGSSAPLNLSFRFRSYAEHASEEQERLAAEERARAGGRSTSPRSGAGSPSPAKSPSPARSGRELLPALASTRTGASANVSEVYRQAVAQQQAEHRAVGSKSQALRSDCVALPSPGAPKRVWRGNSFVPASGSVLCPLQGCSPQRRPRKRLQPRPRQLASKPEDAASVTSSCRDPPSVERVRRHREREGTPPALPAGAAFLRGVLGENFGAWVRNKELEQDDHLELLAKQKSALAAYVRRGGGAEAECTEVSRTADLNSHWSEPGFAQWATDSRKPRGKGAPSSPPRLPPISAAAQLPRAGRKQPPPKAPVGPAPGAAVADDAACRDVQPASGSPAVAQLRRQVQCFKARRSLQDIVELLESLEPSDKQRLHEQTAETIEEVSEYCDELLYTIYCYFLCSADSAAEQDFYFEPPSGLLGEVLSSDVMDYLFRHLRLRSQPLSEYFLSGRTIRLPEDDEPDDGGRRRHDTRPPEERAAERAAALSALRWKTLADLRASRLAETYTGGMRRWPLHELPAEPPSDESTLPAALAVPFIPHDTNVRKKHHNSIRKRLAAMIADPGGPILHLCQHVHFLRLLQEQQRKRPRESVHGEQPEDSLPPIVPVRS